ncbi:unnamed protein product [Prorocentrum cordatum]|uniref:Uncharacterized protein n=1 Tax=Prorocentrum cordatum TaxID=2364126 RepID=A0ABN9PT09_9DINO|nr:unnamed protein product [Polarella glacialis]
MPFSVPLHSPLHLRKLADIHRLGRNQRLEKCSLPPDNVRYCCGHFQTSTGFFGGMLHPGRLVARQDRTRCVLLRRAAYDNLGRRDPAAFEALNVYLTKKRFALSSIARGDTPKLPL